MALQKPKPKKKKHGWKKRGGKSQLDPRLGGAKSEKEEEVLTINYDPVQKGWIRAERWTPVSEFQSAPPLSISTANVVRTVELSELRIGALQSENMPDILHTTLVYWQKRLEEECPLQG